MADRVTSDREQTEVRVEEAAEDARNRSDEAPERFERQVEDANREALNRPENAPRNFGQKLGRTAEQFANKMDDQRP